MYIPQYVLLRICLGGMDYYLAQPPPTDFSDFTSSWLLWGLRADCAALCRRGQVWDTPLLARLNDANALPHVQCNGCPQHHMETPCRWHREYCMASFSLC